MKKYFFLCLTTLLFLASCTQDDDIATTNNTPKYRHTVLIYMAAQNSLGYEHCDYLDSIEIAMGATMLKNTNDNIILFIDNKNAPRIYRLYKNTNGNSYIQKVKTYSTDVSSTSSSTLLDVLKFVKTNYPSSSYGLVMWSHGSGWIPDIASIDSVRSSSGSINQTSAFGIDVGTGGSMENDTNVNGYYGPQMDIDDMAQAISESGIHPVYIFFDACIMQCIEVAYSLRNVTDYVVASPATTSAYGAYYYDLIPKGLFAYPYTQDSVKEIADTYYYDAVENNDLKEYYEGQGCVMSVIKTSELDNLANITSQYIDKSISQKASVDMSNVFSYLNFFYDGYPDSYDMSSAMKKLLSDDDYKEWRTEADKCIIHQVASDNIYFYTYGNRDYTTTVDKDSYCGVSMFIPQNKYSQSNILNWNELFKNTKWYTAAGWEQTGW